MVTRSVKRGLDCEYILYNRLSGAIHMQQLFATLYRAWNLEVFQIIGEFFEHITEHRTCITCIIWQAMTLIC